MTMTRVDKFNEKAEKKDIQVIEPRIIEQKLVAQMEERKQELNTIAVLTHTVQLLSKQVEGLLKAKATDAITMDGIGDMLHTVLLRQASTMSATDMRISILFESHRNHILITDSELHELGVSHYVNHLHQYRFDQMKDTGSYTDPIHLTTLSVEPITKASVVKAKEWLAAPTTDIGLPRGPKPARIKAAMEIMSQHSTKGGSYRWKEGGKQLVFAILAYLEWTGINITKTNKLQATKIGRCVIQDVMARKETYGIFKWSDLISQYNTFKEVRK
jgi:hypothetical protein